MYFARRLSNSAGLRTVATAIAANASRPRGGGPHQYHGDAVRAKLVEESIGCVVAKVKVEEDEGGPLIGDGGARLGEARGLPDPEAVELQIHPADHPQGCVVLDHQNG
jgi:hypothetical protein